MPSNARGLIVATPCNETERWPVNPMPGQPGVTFNAGRSRDDRGAVASSAGVPEGQMMEGLRTARGVVRRRRGHDVRPVSELGKESTRCRCREDNARERVEDGRAGACADSRSKLAERSAHMAHDLLDHRFRGGTVRVSYVVY